MCRPRTIHFAPTILPQNISVSSNWHGIYERGRMKNIVLLIYFKVFLQYVSVKKRHIFMEYLLITNDSKFFWKDILCVQK